MDKLQEIFDKQQEFNARLGIVPREMDLEEQNQWLLNYCRALSQETAELVDSCSWKWWQDSQKLNLQNARVEIVDLLHFLVSLAMVSGMTAQDLHRMYMQKLEINHNRQDTGYKVKKDDNSEIS